MKLDYKLLKKFTLALGIASPIAFALRIYTYWKELDVTTGFFSGNGAGCFLFNVMAFIVFFLGLLLTYHKKGSSVGNASVAAPQNSVDPADDSLVVQDGDPLDEVEEQFPQYFLHGFAKMSSIWHGAFSAFAALFMGFAFLAHGASFFLEKSALSDPYTIVYMALSLISGGFYLFYAFQERSLAGCESTAYLQFGVSAEGIHHHFGLFSACL